MKKENSIDGKYAIEKDRFDQLMDKMPKNADGSLKLFPEASKLRYSMPILNGVGTYVVDLKEQMGDKITCPCLARNDVFVPNTLGIYIKFYNASTKVTKLYPYAPYAPTGEASVHAAGFTNEQIEALYHGQLQMKQDSTTVLSSFPMEVFKTVPEVQGAFVLNSSDEAVSEHIQSEGNIADFQQLLIPRYYLCGTRDLRFVIDFDAAGKTFPVTEGWQASLEVIMFGNLIKGGCEYFDNNNWTGGAVGRWG